MKKTSDRLEWVDATRGVGIILVAFCHIYFEYTRVYIYSFLIPLFFIVSGFVYQKDKYLDVFSFARQRARSLLFPYFLWSFVLFLLWAIADSGEFSILKGFSGIFVGICDHEYLDWGMMMWFIPTLYLTEVIYDFLVRKSRHLHFFVGLLTGLGYAYSMYVKSALPWGLNISLVMLFFFHIGVVSVDYVKRQRKKMLAFFFPVFVMVYFFSSWMNNEIYSELGDFSNPLLYMVSGVSGSFMIVILLRLIRIKWLETVGCSTLVIMIFHLRFFTFLRIIEEYVLRIAHHNDLKTAVVFVLCAIFVLTPISILVNRKYRFLVYPSFFQNKKSNL